MIVWGVLWGRCLHTKTRRSTIQAGLMETWDAATWLRGDSERLEHVSSCPLTPHRQTNASGQSNDAHCVERLSWTAAEQTPGKRGPLNECPNGHQVKRFRVLRLGNGGL
ncbi:hypothetical protein U14_01302 [Candidatus Moduliflexus flocculans]|uniref:Uncharacterized protein n=1 Tax=Candidatus Moduliflexus flocculans TaxID=1499966 RepID=A0A0S6VW80_9BACT|nr:hypothetical protein U14_01302 [Candidatus Moduliflexus flocculans]